MNLFQHIENKIETNDKPINSFWLDDEHIQPGSADRINQILRQNRELNALLWDLQNFPSLVSEERLYDTLH